MDSRAEIRRVKEFVTAGNAVFTIENILTGGRFTFKVRRPRARRGERPSKARFVSVLTGPNNSSYHDYTYIGCIYNNGRFKLTAASKLRKSAKSVRSFEWFWKKIDVLPSNVRVYHEGRCGRCGRRLTVPNSVMSGFGPECINLIGR